MNAGLARRSAIPDKRLGLERDQNLDRQVDALEEFGVPTGMVFSDKMSGKNFERSEYRRMADSLEERDVVVIKGINRLGRNSEEIVEEWRTIIRRSGGRPSSCSTCCCSIRGGNEKD